VNILWTPWRLKFILGEKPDKCVLCAKPQESSDRENYILHRGQLCYIMLNLYPYTNGHLMIVPYRHEADITRLEGETLQEMMRFAQAGVAAVTQAMKPTGFNMGMNLGRFAGAGIDDHLHMHLVPRWSGDANFMTVLGETRLIPEDLDSTYDRLLPALERELSQ
jgi:ATP adenylyltransferase